MHYFNSVLEEIQFSARMAVANTSTVRYYLKRISSMRFIHGNHSVILDADNCIVVI